MHQIAGLRLYSGIVLKNAVQSVDSSVDSLSQDSLASALGKLTGDLQ